MTPHCEQLTGKAKEERGLGSNSEPGLSSAFWQMKQAGDEQDTMTREFALQAV